MDSGDWVTVHGVTEESDTILVTEQQQQQRSLKTNL